MTVGGIREKALAARRAGIRTLILPALNEPDLEELPPDIRREMTFVPVEALDQVIKVAMPDGGSVNELESQEVPTEAHSDR
jgi:ATP-dependent Lon protease